MERYQGALARGNYIKARRVYTQTPKGKAFAKRQRLKRGAITRGAGVAELIDRLVIYERDGWECQLCRTPVDQALVWPDRLSPSLDHIIPISLGGTHVEANVQLAHLYCNTVKGNRRTA